jgi:hypothetical protein
MSSSSSSSNSVRAPLFSNSYTFTGDRSSAESPIIPFGVASIGTRSFEDCAYITIIIIPSSVGSLNFRAFRNCSSLGSIDLPDGLATIGGSAFEGNVALSFISIPDSVSFVGDSAFLGCVALERISKEAGHPTVEEWGRANWRKAVATTLKLSIVSCITQLQALTDDELETHLQTIDGPQIVGDCIRFVVQVGEPGLMREIVRYMS